MPKIDTLQSMRDEQMRAQIQHDFTVTGSFINLKDSLAKKQRLKQSKVIGLVRHL